MTPFIGSAAIGLLLLLSSCAGDQTNDVATEAGPDTSLSASADPIASGEKAYMTYCASCHGAAGRGDGPVAEVMETPPADLTQLRLDGSGAYPVDSIYAYIDGRAYVQAHGTREMPVWGNVWGEDHGRTVPQEEIDQRIRELVEYIRTLQDRPQDTSS